MTQPSVKARTTLNGECLKCLLVAITTCQTSPVEIFRRAQGVRGESEITKRDTKNTLDLNCAYRDGILYGFLFQEFVEGSSAYTFGKPGPTALFFAVAYWLSFFIFNLVKLTR
jgi:hypothetical protein